MFQTEVQMLLYSHPCRRHGSQDTHIAQHVSYPFHSTCFVLSGSGAECCSLPSAVLFLKTFQGLGMMELHAEPTLRS